MRSTRDEWTRDLRHAVRALRKAKGFTVVAVGTLALAIGAIACMFSVVDTVLLHPLPYAHVDRLVDISASAPGSDFPPEFPVSAEFYLQYKELSHLLEDVSTYNSFTNTLRVGDRVERIRMSEPTNTLFSTLGARPILGRLPTPEDEDHVAVISYALWQSWFDRDPAVLGRVYDMAGAKRTIVGVMGPEFHFPNDGTLLWISDEIHAEGLVPGRFGSNLVARTKPGVTPEALANELTALARHLPERFGGSPNYAHLLTQHRAVVRTLEERMLGEVARPLWVLLGALALVLAIACTNVANLFLVRAEGRQRDLAVRRAIGAGRGQLVRLQMAEALVVAALAGALAIGLAAALLPVILHAAPSGIPRLSEVGLHAPTFLFTFAAALASALFCGLVPALRASAPDLTRLREGGRGSTRRRRWARNALVAGQTAMALVLLIGSGLLVRSFWQLSHVDPGYDTDDLFTFQIAPEQPQLVDGPSFARFDLDFMARLAALPGVRSVGLVENIPLDESTDSRRMFAEGRDSGPEGGSLLHYSFTAGEYFRTMGIAVLEGRTFTSDDQLTTPGNAIVSRSAANLLWPGEDPIGRRFKSSDDTSWTTVVGVVDDVMQDSFHDKPDPLVYLPLVGPTPKSWWISSPAYVLKTARADSIAPEVRALVRQVAPEAPMYRVYTMVELAHRSMIQLSFTMLTLGIASALALILGAVGLYGVLSYVVAERSREIGVRMALGARAAQVRRMVVAQGARVVGFGVLIGIVAAASSTRALGGLLYGVEAFDAATFAVTSASMIVVGLLASYFPACRASKVEPLVSLRGE
jgi:putative ABC transport system permease protein